MILKHNILFYILVFSLSFSGCRTLEDTEYVGPEVISVPDDFQVIGNNISSSVDSVDFPAGVVYFSAIYTSRVSWSIIVKGLESDAEKKIQGVSQQLDATNTNWNGGSDNLYLFKKNEKAVVILTFFGTSYSLTDTFVIKNTIDYPGILISDFEGNGLVPGWTTFWTAGKMIDRGEKNSPLHSPQGNFYYHLKGDDYNGGTGVGGLSHAPIVGGYGLSGDPGKIYLNIYINGIPNTRLDLRIFESDGDSYTSVQLINWSGWKLVSVPYSEFELSSTEQTDGQNPEKANEMMYLLKSSPAGNVVEANIDYIIFTTNAPFEP